MESTSIKIGQRSAPVADKVVHQYSVTIENGGYSGLLGLSEDDRIFKKFQWHLGGCSVLSRAHSNIHLVMVCVVWLRPLD